MMIGGGVRAHSTPEQFNVSLPHTHQIHGGFLPPHRVRIVGVPAQNAVNFTVNLETSGGEKLMHLNARFHENAVVRNSTQNGGHWQSEERQGGFPFQKGHVFTMDLIAEPGQIHIRVNGNHFANFATRTDAHQVSHLEVHGELQLHCITFFNN